MPAHNIIDNRREKLVDHIARILETSEAARFAVGYFFLSGLTVDNLLKALTDLYHQHDMQDWSRRQAMRRENHEIPTIICSEALV
jgi:hypothetical protein